MQEKNEKETLLKIENLCQYFPMGDGELKAVDNVSFDVKKGEVFGLVGESGCGKTTTGRSIIGLYNITSGDIYFKGRRVAAGVRSYENEIKRLRAEYKSGALEKEAFDKAVAAEKEKIRAAKYDVKNCNKIYAAEQIEKLARDYAEKLADDEDGSLHKEFERLVKIAKKDKITTRIQMIFQDPVASLNPRMTVRETIAEGLIIKGIKDKKYLTDRVCEMLDTVGLLPEHAERYPHEFSGGQRQRIGVARAVIMQPDLIIADEPVSALDVSIQAQVINLLNDLRRELGLTVLFIAHDLSVVKYISDRIGVMYFGKMVELADSDELFAHPLHPYTRSLLSAIPLPDPDYEKQRKRVTYNPLSAHDYETDKPSFREIKTGHFVYCNDAEFERYKSELSQ